MCYKAPMRLLLTVPFILERLRPAQLMVLCRSQTNMLNALTAVLQNLAVRSGPNTDLFRATETANTELQVGVYATLRRRV